MPAKDHYHDAAKNALVKDGWTILQEQVYLSDGYRHVWVDLSAQSQTDQAVILIEIKGFERIPSPLEALMAAIGQYAVYRGMLSFLEMTETLFLAIPQAAYEGVFQAPVAQETIKMLGVKLLVFDPVKEEVMLWQR